MEGGLRTSSRVLVGCCLLSAAMGTVHAWSLFLEPLEVHLDVGRGAVSGMYSVALASITVAVLVGHRLFGRLRGWTVVGVSTAGATAGLLMAAATSSWWLVLVGYGFLFGLANGLGYAFALQRSAEADPTSPGRALASATAAYALGAAIAGALLDRPVEMHGAGTGLSLLALSVAVTGLVAAILVGPSRSPAGTRVRRDAVPRPGGLGRLWMAYGLAVLAGLTALGHAAAIVDQAGGPGGTAVTVANFASAAGGAGMALAAGRSDRRRLAVALPLLTAVLLVAGASAASTRAVVALVPAVAFAYGAIIAVYPTIVRDRYGPDGYPAAYGRVFTAWGVAGLIGPLGAGALFDATGGYQLPLLLAALAAAASGLIARRETGTRDG